jgi:acetyl esterase/lipase
MLAAAISVQMNAHVSVPDMRAYVARNARIFGPPRGLDIERVQIANAMAEWICPEEAASRRVILYLHGGGFVLGWHTSYRSMVARLCRLCSARALAVDYRLAPEQPFPAALDDCVAAYRWLLSSGVAPRQIVIAGDSAGGNLTLSTLLALRDAGDSLPAGAVCLSPVTDLECAGESYRTRRDPVLERDWLCKMFQLYANGHSPRRPLLSPLYADLGGLPPVLLQVGSDEILLSDSTRLAERAREAGVDVTLDVWPGMWHVWQLFAPYLPEANKALESIGAFVGKHT